MFATRRTAPGGYLTVTGTQWTVFLGAVKDTVKTDRLAWTTADDSPPRHREFRKRHSAVRRSRLPVL
ncbi:hypothetical protein IL38_02080 [Actinopolyspora erythraea]|uniref:DUF397 domain-containing protein n=1 Tax=Actinopolyspora erythraea TaxID=414996 RepID=A0ABR4X7T3_9ACTN|nr:hypothetical protein IL38_02080 [Actinopolyspora erythraea]